MQKSWLADLSLLLVAFVWGTTFVIVQNAISVLPPHTFNGIRFFLASVFLFLVLLFLYPQQLKQLSKKMVFAGVILGVWLFGGYAFQTVGLLYTTSSKAGFITGLSVVLVPIFALFVLGQRPKWPAVLGVVAATIGLYLLTLGDSLNLNRGDVFVFFCAISFAGQIILTGKYAPNFPSMALALIQIATVSVLSIIASFLFEDWQHAWQASTILNRDVLWALLITAGPATALAFLAQTICQRFTTPTRVALIFAMEPVFAALTAFIWTDEILGTKAISGCLLIFVGMILSELKPEQLTLKKRTNLVNR
ncbi:DMT family transporter [Ammoniphilus resinae]|uniref:Drug/metabolite transporter (DMT)-like permease n=1 Tax=Ammoniphilus resinae TaxID=861532 RepID=A0ABS4GJF7_9BACL|nr:DMT family transporter [Ammoniphilus resinae]MBP1930384.1 drug/metabolite transporter (DMT)-like permease [Ammoniphilus resinae]